VDAIRSRAGVRVRAVFAAKESLCGLSRNDSITCGQEVEIPPLIVIALQTETEITRSSNKKTRYSANSTERRLLRPLATDLISAENLHEPNEPFAMSPNRPGIRFTELLMPSPHPGFGKTTGAVADWSNGLWGEDARSRAG
jgi:hypothetical protein